MVYSIVSVSKTYTYRNPDNKTDGVHILDYVSMVTVSLPDFNNDYKTF